MDETAFFKVSQAIGALFQAHVVKVDDRFENLLVGLLYRERRLELHRLLPVLLDLSGCPLLEHLDRFGECYFFGVHDPRDDISFGFACPVADPFVLLAIDTERWIFVVVDWAEPNEFLAISIFELRSVALNQLDDVRFSLDPVDFRLVDSGHFSGLHGFGVALGYFSEKIP